jgi:hypothetical protein
MATDHHRPEVGRALTAPEPFDLDDTFTITDVRAAGGFLQDGEQTDAQVFLEIEGTTYAVDSQNPIYTSTHRFTMDLDTYFRLMARLEHAGKTALMMPIQGATT